MQFKIGITDQRTEFPAFLFELERGRIVALEVAEAPFDVLVPSFDPLRDTFYRTPVPLTPEELAEERAIHFPSALLTWKHQIVPGTLGELVLFQPVDSDCAVISPLAALKRLLEAIDTVNTALVHAENGGILFVRNAGKEIRAGASAHSLRTFLQLSEAEREEIFPNLHASEIILSGPDLDRFYDIDLGPLTTARKITVSDYCSLCEFPPEIASLVGAIPHRFTLLIGAAAMYKEFIQA